MRRGGVLLVLVGVLVAGCSPQMTYAAPSPQPTTASPTPSASESPTEDATPSPTPIALKPLVKSVKGESCRFLWDLPKGAVVTNVRHGGPTYVWEGKVYWRLVKNGQAKVIKKTAPERVDTTFLDLEAHPNTVRYNGDSHYYTLVQRSPHDRHRAGVWICGV